MTVARSGCRPHRVLLLVALFGLSTCQPSVEPTETMRATMYDDGLACPGDCDAHVVFAPRHNGTRNAFRPPLENRSAPEACVPGEDCVICFDEPGSSCLLALYRGAGPAEGTFDFTPAFYGARCGLAGLPPQLDEACAALRSAVERHGYDRRVNCFASPDDGRCRPILAAARSLKEEDAAERAACLREGERAYNARQPDRGRQRSLACNYERFGTGGPNSAGTTWRRLLPGACRPGTFVGRDGLDCCGDDLFAVAALHPECSAFFRPR